MYKRQFRQSSVHFTEERRVVSTVRTALFSYEGEDQWIRQTDTMKDEKADAHVQVIRLVFINELFPVFALSDLRIEKELTCLLGMKDKARMCALFDNSFN